MSMIVLAVVVGIGVFALVAGVAMFFQGSGGSVAEDRLDLLAQISSTPGGREGGPEKSLLLEPLDDRQNLLETLVSRWFNLELFIEQAGVKLSPTKFMAISAVLLVAGAAVCSLLPMGWLAAPLGGLTLGVLPFGWLYVKRGRRLAAFAKQLPEALELLSRALRAGHSLGAGFHLVADEISEPLSREFGRCYEEQNFGVSLEDALEGMTERVPNLDLRFFATAVILQRTTGGDLAEILDKIGHLIRERFKIYGQVQALTGEGRLSGIVLLALPPALFLVMLRLNYNYIMMLFRDPMGKQLLALAIVMQFLGALVIRKIVNIKV